MGGPFFLLGTKNIQIHGRFCCLLPPVPVKGRTRGQDVLPNNAFGISD